MRRLLVPLLLAAAAALAHAEEAPGACASAIVVDGRLLFGNAVQHPNRLPPREGARDAVGAALGGQLIAASGPRAAIVAACAATAAAWLVTAARARTLSARPALP